jgi:ferric-dicitrate binding protein FerR (iron transport regulator)
MRSHTIAFAARYAPAALLALGALVAGGARADDRPSSDAALAPFVQSLERSEREARERLAQAERQLEAAARLVAQSRDALAAARRTQDSGAQHVASRALARAEAARLRAERQRDAALRQTQRAEHALRAARALAARSPSEPVRFAITVPYGQLEVAAPDGGWRAVDPSSALALHDGARLCTARGAQAELVLALGDSRVLLDQETEVTAHDTPDRSWLDLARGRLHLLIKRWSKEFEVRTPVAVLGVRGTEFAVATDAQGRTTLVVLSGVVEVRAGEAQREPLEIRAGQSVTVRPDGTAEAVQTVDPRALDAWWHGNR